MQRAWVNIGATINAGKPAGSNSARWFAPQYHGSAPACRTPLAGQEPPAIASRPEQAARGRERSRRRRPYVSGPFGRVASVRVVERIDHERRLRKRKAFPAPRLMILSFANKVINDPLTIGENDPDWNFARDEYVMNVRSVAAARRENAMKLLKLLYIILSFAAAMSAVGPAVAAELLGVRVGVQSATKTRIVFDFDGAPDYVLAADGTDGAGRIALDLRGASIKPALRASAQPTGQVAGYRIKATGDIHDRVEIEVAPGAAVTASFVIPPSTSGAKTRLVLDLTAGVAPQRETPRQTLAKAPYQDLAPVIKAATKVADAAPKSAEPSAPAAGGPPVALSQTPLPPPAVSLSSRATANAAPALSPTPVSAAQTWPSASLISPAPRRITVVVDAGHGGADPGATGQKGTKEKDVTLAAAQELAAQLRAKGRYNVVLTRPEDERLHLDERSKIARDNGAELFISLHADSHTDHSVRGGSVYTLSEKGSARAANEVKSDSDYEIYGEKISARSQDVSAMLLDLAQRHTATESGKFASLLLDRLKTVTPLLSRANRREDLYVLLSPDVPAVLFELAYITNADDEKNLDSPAWRKKVMGAVAASIDAYFDAAAQPSRSASLTAPAAP